jgi:predicted TIM-barrel fold metal-dependent hydrolase
LTTTTTRGAEIREQLGHPLIDSDGHLVEVSEVIKDFVGDIGGPAALAKFEAHFTPGERQPGIEERKATGRGSPNHWFWTADALDRATAMLPTLFHERMDELGLDFSLVYPSVGLGLQMHPDDDLRPVLCRALNTYLAETHAGLTDRIMPVAIIPMHDPQEAIDELEHAVQVLGLRAVVLPSFVRRPLPGVPPEYAEHAVRLDTYGIDSDHDYDPVWARCVELQVVPGVHTNTLGYGFRRSVSSYTYNHIGAFAASCEAVCKSLLLGGVFHRFPDLRIAALEGGMGWAASLYADLLRHWDKRRGDAIGYLDPERLDADRLRALIEAHGSERFRSRADAIVDSLTAARTTARDWTNGAAPLVLDEFADCPFESPEDLRDLFVSHIHVGCEADDPMNALAFNTELNPHGARFRVIFGSDISHWDVPDISDVVEEAYELLEHGLVTEADFRDFTFTNPARLYAGTNPDFYAGTRVESAVADLLASEGAA